MEKSNVVIAQVELGGNYSGSSTPASSVCRSSNNIDTVGTSLESESLLKTNKMKVSSPIGSLTDFQTSQTRSLERLVEPTTSETVILNGQTLELSSLVAVAR